MVCSSYVFVLERSLGKIDSGVHLTVVAARCAQCKVFLLFEHEYAQLISRELSRDRAAGDAAAYDKDIRTRSLKRIVPDGGHMHLLGLCALERNVIDHMSR